MATLVTLIVSLPGIDRLWNSGPIKLPQRIVRVPRGVSGGPGRWGEALITDPETAVT